MKQQPKGIFMKASIIRLSPLTKKLLKTMSFPEIPEEANYVAFTEDGNAEFLESFDHRGVGIPTMAIVSIYEDVEITVE